MDIRPIRTSADHKATLKEISFLMESDPALGTPDGDRLDVQVTLVQAYEARHVPVGAPDPVEAIKFRMEQSGLSGKDLAPLIGKKQLRVRSAQPQTPFDAGHDPHAAQQSGDSGGGVDRGDSGLMV
jgi:antitoxin component HigA of HigAB toxin-antitoxin module